MDMTQVRIVFVGCGGTFWAAHPYYAALIRGGKAECEVVDMDTLSEANQLRQWVTGYDVGTPKSVLGGRLVSGTPHMKSFRGWTQCSEREYSHCTIFVTNVDNDRCRLEVADWCSRAEGLNIQIVSGCENTFGQVYAGAWYNGEAYHDWRRLHQDVVDELPPEGEACGGQDIRANAITGFLSAQMLETHLEYLRRVSVDSRRWEETTEEEVYWALNDEGLVTVTTRVVPIMGDQR